MDNQPMIYLDNSATTALCPEAKRKMTEAAEVFGNPSSLHRAGQEALALCEEARREILLSLGVRGTSPSAGRLIFTSCGSEADNLALFGTAHAKERRRGGRILSTDCEHPAVENVLRALEREGYEVIRVPTRGGVFDLDFYEKALNERTFLVTVMTVNNETGAHFPIRTIFSMAKAKNPDIVTHTDAVQGYLKCPMTPASLFADLVTLSGHKIHAPKGIGALYLSGDAFRRKDIAPVLLGGGQEGGFRSGTENVIGIAGFGAAAKVGYAHLSDDLSHLAALRGYAIEKLSSLPLKFHIPQGDFAPHILNFALPDIKSETALHALSAHGIFVSGGSACSSHAGAEERVSRSLVTFGVSPEEAQTSLRVSFCRTNTKEEIDALAEALSEEIERLVRIHR